MKKTNIFIISLFTCFIFVKPVMAQQQEQPNILWILTDDQRYDAIRAFNKMLHNRDMSELGYVESPNVDKLTQMGTTFINTYCQAAGCAPSRSSMHMGRYPFRSGVYEFEYYNNNAEHMRPTIPEQLANMGYQTVHVGKLGIRMKTKTDDGKMTEPDLYQQSFFFKDLRKDGLTAWGKDRFTKVDGKKLPKPLQIRFFVTPEGKFEWVDEELEEIYPEYKGTGRMTMEKYDLVRHYNKNEEPSDFEGGIISGVSSREAGKTRDGYYSSIFEDFLKHEDVKFKVGSKTYNGVNTSKPLFCHIGYDFPHTPVLPPADYRARFQEHTYNVPQFDEKELKTMPKQQKRQVMNGYSDHLSDTIKQKMIQDYFAFCAYGDALIGQAVEAFITYSEEKKQPYMIVYVCGDHGWKLNDHGSISKFSYWDIDTHNPIVVVSSDKDSFPEGKVVTNFTEFVDIAPTIISAAGGNVESDAFDYLDGLNLKDVASGKAPNRNYIVGEAHAVTGPRAFIRTKEYVFSMQTRPHKKRGENMEWALNASYKELDPALHYIPEDPKEINNLAFNKAYETIAMALKDKLINIVLGDNRVEVAWGKKADGTKLYRSNFAPGAHDYKLQIN